MLNKIKNICNVLAGGGVIKSQVDTIRCDANSIIDDLKCLKSVSESGGASDINKTWRYYVVQYGVTTDSLKAQYRVRCFTARLLLLVMALIVAITIASANYLVGLAGFVTAMMFYLRNGLRLYQIRGRTLCGAKGFIDAVRKEYIEFFPRNLPSDWQVLDEKEK